MFETLLAVQRPPLTRDQVSTLLPPRARTLLVAAAGVDPSKGRCESVERTRALDHAIQRVKQDHPQFFRERQ